MLILLPSSKTIDTNLNNLYSKSFKPIFLDESNKLVQILKSKNKNEISRILKTNSKISELNYNRYQNWDIDHNKSNSKQAIFSFLGMVYKSFNFSNYVAKDFENLQNKLRLLSGLYGILKPLDLIQPYRLEMSTKFDDINLYDFWTEKITNSINEECNDFIVNLASKEYSDVINFYKLKCK